MSEAIESRWAGNPLRWPACEAIDDSHVGNTLLNRPWLQAVLDVESGTPVEEVWMTEAEAEAYHQARAGALWLIAMPLLREQGSVLE